MFERKTIPAEGFSGVFLSTWSGLEACEWDDVLVIHRASDRVLMGTAKLACLCLTLTDEKGKRVYPTTQRPDIVKVGQAYTKEEVASLFEQAAALNGVFTRKEDVELAEKN